MKVLEGSQVSFKGVYRGSIVGFYTRGLHIIIVST